MSRPGRGGERDGGATSNVFFVDDGVLKTPSTDLPLLPGITRSVVFDLAREEGFPVETGEYDVADVRAADEAFLTNSTWRSARSNPSMERNSTGGR
ncbi:aminotransferase class IV [Haloarculaceae archaeon H-GB11]|nr:aminotransferase class IV [Haloarculaceae archaeon H-GB11]